MSILQNEPNWLVSAVVGAVFGVFLPFAAKACYFVFRRFKKYHLEGLWHGYLYSYKTNQSIICEFELRIRKGFTSRYRVRMRYTDGTMAYKGTMDIENAQVYMNLSSRQHEEHPVFRFNLPIPSNDRTLTGLWLSFDNDMHIGSGAVVLSRDPLDAKDFEEIAKTGIHSERGKALLRINR